MQIEIRIDIDYVVCEAEIIDPHGNSTLVAQPTLEELLAAVTDETLSIHTACELAEEENG